MQQVAMNGAVMWAFVVKTDDGMRMQFLIDDWQRLNVGHGQRLPVRIPGKDDV